jgi:hypothetical protein
MVGAVNGALSGHSSSSTRDHKRNAEKHLYSFTSSDTRFGVSQHWFSRLPFDWHGLVESKVQHISLKR